MAVYCLDYELAEFLEEDLIMREPEAYLCGLLLAHPEVRSIPQACGLRPAQFCHEDLRQLYVTLCARPDGRADELAPSLIAEATRCYRSFEAALGDTLEQARQLGVEGLLAYMGIEFLARSFTDFVKAEAGRRTQLQAA